MSTIYSDLDKLVLERWDDVRNLAQAQKDIQARIEEVVEVAGERVGRWLREQGYECEYDLEYGDISAWRPSWADRRRGPRIRLVLGGFCPTGYRKADEHHPFLWVYSELESFKVKEPDRFAFAADLRKALGGDARQWEDPTVDDLESPLGQYLREFGVREQCRLVSAPDALEQFALEQFPKLFVLSDSIEKCLQKLQE